MTRTADVLAGTAELPGRAQKVVVGFAAETEDLERHARQKLQRKGLDAIIANDVSAEDTGFGTGDNVGLLVSHDGCVPLARCSKPAFAAAILEHLTPLIRARLQSSE